MFCKNCGNMIKEGATFCPNCGTAAPVTTAPKAVAPTPVPEVKIGKDVARGGEVKKVRKTSVAGIVFALVSMLMMPLWWFSSSSGGWNILGEGKYPLYLMFDLVEGLPIDSVTSAIANIVVVTAISLAAIALILYMIYIILEFTKNKKPFCMVLASVISLMLIAVCATVAVGMNIVNMGDIAAVTDALTGDFIGFFTGDAIVLSIPVAVLFVTSILGMCFAKNTKKVVSYADAPVARSTERVSVPKVSVEIKPVESRAEAKPVTPSVTPSATKEMAEVKPVAPVIKPIMTKMPEIKPVAPVVTPEAPVMPQTEEAAEGAASRLTSTMRTSSSAGYAGTSAPSKPASTSSAFERAGDL